MTNNPAFGLIFIISISNGASRLHRGENVRWASKLTNHVQCSVSFICSKRSNQIRTNWTKLYNKWWRSECFTCIANSHHPFHRFSEGSTMITWRCYYPSSNFHKHVWLTADCPRGRLDLKQENNEQNITWLVIRENVSGEDISSELHCVLFLPTTRTGKFGKQYMKFRFEQHMRKKNVLPASVTVSVKINHSTFVKER